MNYSDDDMLMLSGIQHFMYCARQWALIHIEQVWQDNGLTAEGSLLHSTVDDPYYRQKNDDKITLRGVKIASQKLGLYGVADAIELHPTNNIENSITHPRYPGRWSPYVIEYKHGSPKVTEIDKVQLTAQVMCLEEMYNIEINNSALFYFTTRHREQISITQQLRELTSTLATEMHRIFINMELPCPQAKLKPCINCSLRDLCMPKLQSCQAVSTYLKNNLYETSS